MFLPNGLCQTSTYMSDKKQMWPIPIRLKEARLAKGLTQEQVADMAGLSRSSIARYEGGSGRPLDVSLNMLASLYGKPVEWFYGEEQPAVSTDDIDIADPELALFFRGEWDEFTEEEKEFLKGMIRESRELLRKRRESGQQ